MNEETGITGDARLVLGPLLRYTDTTTAAVWVQTSDDADVAVVTDQGTWTARTFAVHGHHYALVEVEGLAPGSAPAYEVTVAGRHVWPPPPDPDLPLPPPVLATLEPDKPLRLAFASCRTSVAHDEEGNRTHGVDALRAYALAMAGITEPPGTMRWPDAALFLGDQVYADETTEPMHDFIAARRDIEQPPGEELADFTEYAELYRLAWSDPANRWLLSTLPTAMIFDDHDVRDDWNTSLPWLQEVRAEEWWHGRIVAGLASYWVYQHLGNLSPAQRAADEIYRVVLDHDGAEELDLSETLDAFAERVDRAPETYRWSFVREVAGCRLVVVDSRAGRLLREDRREMLDDVEMEWLDGQLTGDVEHLLIGTSIPFLLPTGLHHIEAFDEALAEGAWGPRWARVGERIRQGVDLEHWAAFQSSFQRVCGMVAEVATGSRGAAPRTVTFLSGDVHHSYVAEVVDLGDGRGSGVPDRSTVVQAVCSPMRNPLHRVYRHVTFALAYGVADVIGRVTRRTRTAPRSPWRWDQKAGPWFENNIATLDVTASGLRMWWATGDVVDDDHGRPVLRLAADVHVDETGVRTVR
ncbi:alkaline phosphatase family protein [Nocardioidaceae bacterium]|nr:alkaline phosphatase family protein [Nocardioidaceae bacterium]